jgi:UDP-2,4-diacetamido-2,4,6-trideoxy-beta-L-altropyranose hydrolase
MSTHFLRVPCATPGSAGSIEEMRDVQFVFRTDASAAIGSGHVMRCLTLAQSLREGGAQVVFVARALDGNLNGLLEKCGFTVVALADSPGGEQSADWQSDARETRAALAQLGTHPDWLIVDHYAFGRGWETQLRDAAAQILVIDDLADRQHDCDVLLDQNLVADMATRHTGKVPQDCICLLGPRYALLQAAYAELRREVGPREGPVRRVCIYFGAADRCGLTLRALRAFVALERPDVGVDLVMDGATADAQQVLATAAGHDNVMIHSHQPSLAPLLASADLAVGAAGATSWERLCLGVPALVVTIAENQRPIAAALAQRGLVEWLGHHSEVSEADLQRALGRHLAAGADTARSRAAQALVDGAGVERVRAVLTVNAESSLRVRPAASSDEELLLQWANDPATRKNSFHSARIAPDEHRRWLHDRLSAAEDCVLLVVETARAVPIANVRFDKTAAGWKINYALAPEYRGRGLGLRIVELALSALAQRYPQSSSVLAQVLAANEPSQRVFKRLGFKVINETATAVEFRRAL